MNDENNPRARLRHDPEIEWTSYMKKWKADKKAGAASIAAKQTAWEEAERVAAAEKVAWNKAYEVALGRTLDWHIEAAKTKSGPYAMVNGVSESMDSMECVERNAVSYAAYLAWVTYRETMEVDCD